MLPLLMATPPRMMCNYVVLAQVHPVIVDNFIFFFKLLHLQTRGKQHVSFKPVFPSLWPDGLTNASPLLLVLLVVLVNRLHLHHLGRSNRRP